MTNHPNSKLIKHALATAVNTTTTPTVSDLAMSAAAACAAAQRHTRLRPRRRPKTGFLDVGAREVANRLLAEGVPPNDVRTVAAEIKRCLPFLTYGDDIAIIPINPWTHQLLIRYGDKLGTILMSTRGKVDLV